MVYQNPDQLIGVRVLGVDEHVRKHTHRPGEPSALVTVLVDLTPSIDRTGPARLMDMVPGRSADVLRSWLKARDSGFRAQVEVVTMMGSPGTPPLWKTWYPRHVG
nr:transposase [Corynebacterium ulcerans]